MFEQKEYQIESIDELSDFVTKGTTPTTLGFNYVDNGINFIKIENISEDGQIISDNLMHITLECHEKLKRSQLREGDILFSIAGAIGRTTVITKNILPANTNQALAIIRLKEHAPILQSYLIYALKTSSVKRQYAVQKKGVAQVNLTLKNVSDLKITIPPMEKQISFSQFVTQVDKSKYRGEKSWHLLYVFYKKAMDMI